MTLAVQRRYLALVVATALLSMGCPTNLAAIQRSDLSPSAKLSAQLYDAESAWRDAKVLAVQTIRGLRQAGVEIPAEAITHIRMVRDAGNLALELAALALANRDTGPTGQFIASLGAVRTAILDLGNATGGLD